MIRRVVMLLMLTVPAMADADTVTPFAAELTPEAVIIGGVMPSAGVSQAFGSADFVLTVPDAGSPTLTYSIEIHGIDFVLQQFDMVFHFLEIGAFGRRDLGSQNELP